MAQLTDFETIVYQALTPLKTTVGGRLYKRANPLPGTESIVVTGLVYTGDDDQGQATVVVNIYVPDLSAGIVGTVVGLPDSARLNALANLALPLLTGSASNWLFGHVDQHIFDEDTTSCHYVSLKVDGYYQA